MTSDQSVEGHTILGVPPYPYAQPLWYGLRERPEFAIRQDVPARLAIQLRNRETRAALLSPTDYARDYAMYRIVPHAAVSSHGQSRTILLRFRKGLRSIRTIAINPASASEIVLARIVLSEKYGINPTFVPVPGDPGAPAHPETDATLLVADTETEISEDLMDIADEWNDLTQLPYVHGMWVSREQDLSVGEMNLLVETARSAGGMAKSPGDDAGRFTYTLGEMEVSGLVEFLRMAYYHGILQDIPDVKFHRLDEEKTLRVN